MKIVFALYILTITCFCSAQSTTIPLTDWSKMEIHGQVKELTEEDCFFYTSEKESNKVCKQGDRYYFDSKGYIIRHDRLIGSQVGWKHIYEYDSLNILKKVNMYAQDTVLESICEITCDKRGNMIQQRMMTNKSSDPKIHIYGRDTALYTYTYDIHNRKIKMIALDSDDKQFIKQTYKYDSLGNIIEETINEIKYEYSYKLDNNRIIEKTIKRTDQSQSISTSKILYNYNTQGQCTKEVELNEKGVQTSVTTCTYDQEGNWIRKDTIDNEQRHYFTERKIVYY